MKTIDISEMKYYNADIHFNNEMSANKMKGG